MKLLVIFLLSFSMVGVSSNDIAVQDGDNPEPENSISDVMKKAHMGGSNALMRKAMKGEATDEELKELVSLYVDMMDNEPPKGSAEDWEQATGKVVIAATRTMLGRDGATDLLKEATNCQSCHDVHKAD